MRACSSPQLRSAHLLILQKQSAFLNSYPYLDPLKQNERANSCAICRNCASRTSTPFPPFDLIFRLPPCRLCLSFWALTDVFQAIAAFPDVADFSDSNLYHQHYFPGAVSLFEDLDKDVMLDLRDGRKIFGNFRSFDQVAWFWNALSFSILIFSPAVCKHNA